MKSEPDTYSIDRLAREGTAAWDGVRNYQARNFLRAMRRGDRALFYHSNTSPSAIAGEMEIVREAYPDPPSNARSPWFRVDVKFVRKYGAPLPLEAIRAVPSLQGMVLLHHRRLSVQPVTAREWAILQGLLQR